MVEHDMDQELNLPHGLDANHDGEYSFPDYDIDGQDADAAAEQMMRNNAAILENDPHAFDYDNEVHDDHGYGVQQGDYAEGLQKFIAGDNQVNQITRHSIGARHIQPKSERSAMGSFLWLLVIVHVMAVLYWVAAWFRQRKSKEALRKVQQTPQKVSCGYEFGTFQPQSLLPANFLPGSTKKAQA